MGLKPKLLDKSVKQPQPLPIVPPAEKPLPRLSFLILSAIYRLMDEASGKAIADFLRADLRSPIEAPQIYINLKKLAEDEQLIEPTVSKPTPRAPPRKLYRLTEAGTLELAASVAYYELLIKRIRDP